MVTTLGEVHIWSVKNQAVIGENDIGCFTYHDKLVQSNEDFSYGEQKIQYTESRDTTWTPKNKRPDKLKDNLKELEELILNHKCINCKWLTRKLLQLVLVNGTIATLVVSLHTGDVDKIFIDKSLVGKLSGENPSDVLVTETYILLAYPDKPKLDFIYLMKRQAAYENLTKLDKISSFDPRLQIVDLPGPTGRRLDRKLNYNQHKDLILCWWQTPSEEAWPWSPMTGEIDRANMVLLSVNGPRLDVVGHKRTECDPIGISFSLVHPHQILSVEKANGPSGELTIDSAIYECSKNKIYRFRATSVSIKSPVISHSKSAFEDKLLLGCEDHSLVMYDEQKKITQLNNSSCSPDIVSWHPSGTVVFVASFRGEIQIFDMALAPLMIQCVAESPSPSNTLKLGSHFKSPPVLKLTCWSPPLESATHIAECTDSLFCLFDGGPMVAFQFHLGVMGQGSLSPLHLINQYIKHQQIDEAINLLSSMNWNLDSQICYAGLCTITNHLLRQTLNAEREAQLEAALGTFYAPLRPLSEATVLEFRDPMSRLARRFFHHLLRYTRFEKAFLLAVDIGARDLFMDIHYVAKDKGETSLAEVAQRKAEHIDADYLGSDYVEGYNEEGDDDSNEDSYSDGEYADGPPPRPPRRMYNQPSLGRDPLQVPPEPVYANPPPDPRFRPIRSSRPQEHDQSVASANNINVSDLAIEQLEHDLNTQLCTEYTAALLDEIPPPHFPENEEVEEGSDQPSNVKVIHFGLV